MARKQSKTGIYARQSSIVISFTIDGERYRETLRLNPTPKNMEYASKMRIEIMRKIELGIFQFKDFFPNSKHATKINQPTFGSIAEKWLSTNSHLAKSTVDGYRKSLDTHILPTLCNRRIDDITFSDLAALLGSKKWKSQKTRNNTAIPIRRVFEMAFLDGVLSSNPAARLKNQKVQKEAPDPLTLDEVNTVLVHMSKYGEQVVNYFELAFFTGLRTSEIIALRWGDIDFANNVMRICRAKVLQEIKTTKTNQIRDVELNSRALLALQRQKAHTFLSGLEVFNNPVTNQPWLNDQSQRRIYWVPTLKALGLRHRDAYQTRHTYATLNLMAGANPMWVSRQLGHTSMKMLLEVYSRWIDQADRSRELSKIEAFFSDKTCDKQALITNKC